MIIQNGMIISQHFPFVPVEANTPPTLLSRASGDGYRSSERLSFWQPKTSDALIIGSFIFWVHREDIIQSGRLTDSHEGARNNVSHRWC